MTSWPQLQAKIHEFGGAAEGVLAAFTDDLDRRPVPRVLYHYTNEEGLYGILKSGSIRLSDLFYQNDPSELQHGIDYALRLLRRRTTEDKLEFVCFETNLLLLFAVTCRISPISSLAALARPETILISGEPTLTTVGDSRLGSTVRG